jgi:coenzyme F420-dependent glucose-6-phosphate dehydrogenase
MLKIGYKASAEQFGPRELLEFAVLAERLGFDSVFVSDHFQPWRHHGGHAPFSLAWLGALGERTTTVTIGTSVLTPTFRYHPAIVAQAFGTLGALYPGRVLLGVGTGESLNEVPATGHEWPKFKERFGRLRESIELIQRLWTEERVTFEGEYYRTRSATIYDRPERPVPVYIAASGPRERSRTDSSAPAARRPSCIARPCCPRSTRASPRLGGRRMPLSASSR